MDWMQLLEFVLEALAAAVGATVAVWKIIKNYVKNTIDKECTARKTADTNIENKVMNNSQDIHNFMGKLELLDQRIQTYERNQLQEIFALKAEINDGLHKIELQIERLGKKINS